MIKLEEPIKLTSSNYSEYALEDYRSYGLFILYSVATKKFGCYNCKEVRKDYITLVDSYKKYYPNSVDVFFAITYFESNQEGFLGV